jgi:hypothetical protein
MRRRGAGETGGRRAAVPAPDITAQEPARFDLDKPPRPWFERTLASRLGGFGGGEQAIARALACYDRGPTLARLGAGSPVERHLFVLAVAVLIDELADVSALRVELALKSIGGEEELDLAEREGALERIRAVVDSGTAAKTDTRRSRRGVSTSSQRRDLRGIRAKNPSQRVMRGILTIYAGPEISKRKTQVQ